MSIAECIIRLLVIAELRGDGTVLADFENPVMTIGFVACGISTPLLFRNTLHAFVIIIIIMR